MGKPENISTLNIEHKSKIQSVNDRLKSIPHDAISRALNEKLETDKAAGIIIAPLKNIKAVESDGQMYDSYAAQISRGKHVNAHLHKRGPEPYHILSGEGEMYLGIVQNNEVKWNDEPQQVKAGDLVEVEEGQVHSLKNKGKEPLVFTFACPPEHINDKDRFFTEGLTNGTPPFLRFRSKL